MMKISSKVLPKLALFLAVMMCASILLSGCSSKNMDNSNDGNASSVVNGNSESISSEEGKEAEVRFSFKAISFDEKTGVNTMEYIINDKKFIVDAADKKLEVVLEMLRETVENGTFTVEEIWDEAFYFSDYYEYEPKGQNAVKLIEVEGPSGKMKNGYIEGTMITLPSSDVNNVLASIRYCIQYGEEYEIAIELGEYCQQVRQNQNITNALDPFVYHDFTYDLSNPSSVRSLCVAIVNEIFTDHIANAVLDYYKGEINREELEYVFSNPREDSVLLKYKSLYGKFDNESTNIVDEHGDDLLRYGYNDSAIVGENGMAVLEAVLLSKDGPIMVRDETSAIEALELLCKFDGTQSYAMFFGDFDYFLLTQSAIRNQRDGMNYDLQIDYKCNLDMFSIDN